MILTHDFPFEAIWHSNDSDFPVVITGVLGEINGERYFSVKGTKTGVPENQIEDYIYYLYEDKEGKQFATRENLKYRNIKEKEFYNKNFVEYKLVYRHTLKQRINKILYG